MLRMKTMGILKCGVAMRGFCHANDSWYRLDLQGAESFATAWFIVSYTLSVPSSIIYLTDDQGEPPAE